MQAFGDLSTCRQVGFGLGPIPWRDMIAYGLFHGFRGDDLKLFVDVIREIDRRYLVRLEKDPKVETSP